ncbi:MAG: phage distal tail protein, Rcc01695 family [Methyloceanibacter sp.]|uniref:phage distal tail protein, Rcc01695 family n=1 Tax=Methyloceanibacter sp. TaxID=1965321 RepID=UPI003D6D8EFD
MAFHDVRFPSRVSLGASGGPERRTEIVVLGSGHEERNSRWADSKRSYNAGYGIKSVDDLHAVIAFFEERRGRLHGFRFKDWTDYKSCAPSETPTALDQAIGVGDGETAAFQLVKTYGSGFAPWTRAVNLPVAGSVLVAVDGIVQDPGDFAVSTTTGVVTFLPEHIPPVDVAVTAGFEFDVPVRFDTDQLEINLSQIEAGSIPHIPIVEIRL